jgi:hypothetical protein
MVWFYARSPGKRWLSKANAWVLAVFAQAGETGACPPGLDDYNRSRQISCTNGSLTP